MRPGYKITIYPNRHPPFNISQLEDFQSKLEDAKGVADAAKERQYASGDCNYYVCVLADSILKQLAREEANPRLAVKTETIQFKASDVDATVAEAVCFHHGDMFTLAQKLCADRQAHVCLQNPENDTVIGGGAFSGAHNFEEDQFRIMLGLAASYINHAIQEAKEKGLKFKLGLLGRPLYAVQLRDNQAHFTSGLTVAKAIVPRLGLHWTRKTFDDLAESEQYTVSLVGHAAFHLHKNGGFSKNPWAYGRTVDRIRAQVSAMAQKGVTYPVLTDIGCGAFNNDPKEIGAIYYEILYREGYANYFKEIHFAVVNQENLQQLEHGFEEAKQSVPHGRFAALYKNHQVDNIKRQHLDVIRSSLAGLTDGRQVTYPDWFKPCVNPNQSHQNETKVYCNDQFLDWCQVKSNEARSQFTRLGYVPGDGDRVVEGRLREMQLLASEHDEPEVETNRQFSKHRVVIGPVTNLLNRSRVNILTACAPNMMSPGSDEFKFFVSTNWLGRHVLRRDRYKVACESLAHLICQSASKHGMRSLLMPDFGLGVYAKHLEPQSKEAAREIMYAAFFKASAKARIRLRWCLWEGDKNVHKNVEFSGNWLSKAAAPKDHMSFFSGDYVDLLQYLPEDEVALNPGSNRTVGGMYVKIGAKTLEEQIAQFTTLLWTQSTTLNPRLVEQFSDNNLKVISSIQPVPILANEFQDTPQPQDRWLPRVAWLLVIGGSAAVGLLVALGEVASSASPILSFLSLLGIKVGASGLLGSTAVLALAASATLLLPSLVVFLAMKWMEERVLAKQDNPQASKHIRHGLRMGRRYVGLGVGIALALAFTAVAWYVVIPLLVGLPLLMMAVHAFKSYLTEPKKSGIQSKTEVTIGGNGLPSSVIHPQGDDSAKNAGLTDRRSLSGGHGFFDHKGTGQSAGQDSDSAAAAQAPDSADQADDDLQKAQQGGMHNSAS